MTNNNKRNIKIETEKYLDQKAIWPKEGKHILAQYNDEAVLVYQAFSPEIVEYAAENGHFGGPHYLPDRTTWVKTNFLWMMFRSGWGVKPKQEATVGIWIKREAFEDILSKALAGSFKESVHESQEEYEKMKQRQARQKQMNKSKAKKERKEKGENNEDIKEEEEEETKENTCVVRLQWDPDHTPCGGKVTNRRAIQLGIQGWKSFLTGEDIVGIEDLTSFVEEQRANVSNLENLITPKERVYKVINPELKRILQLDEWNE